MTEIVRKIIKIVILSAYRVLALVVCFLSEADVLILSLRGRHFSLWYVLIRLFISVVILLCVSEIGIWLQKKLKLGDS